MNPSEYFPSLAHLETAAQTVYAVMPPTPQYNWPVLSQTLGLELWVKHENHTPIGAFKIRGGLTYFDDLSRHPPSGVISATRGNHGQSIGFAARKYAIPATVVVPHGNSTEKNDAMRAFGVKLIEHGEDFQAAKEHAQALAVQEKLHMVPSFHPLLVRGVASYSLELMRALPNLDVLYVPIGLGSGISGAVAAREALGRKLDIVGVVSAQAPAYARSFQAKAPVSAPVSTRIADGLACRVPEPDALEIIQRHISDIVEVTDEEIEDAMRLCFSSTHNIAEGAGAAALAAVYRDRARLKNKTVACVLSGGNVDRLAIGPVLSE
ncbi:MAG: threonine dehydratase [Burkholderiales bacterium]